VALENKGFRQRTGLVFLARKLALNSSRLLS
jgi:hypothetical protein